MENTALNVRRWGIFCDVGYADGRPLTPELRDRIISDLSYRHYHHYHGQDYDPVTGGRRTSETFTVRLSREVDGRVQTLYGFIPRIFGILDQCGQTYSFEDLTLPSPRGTEVYVPRRDLLYTHITPRNRQDEFFEAVFSSLGGLIDAAPAFGKSYGIVGLCFAYPKAKIDVVVKGNRLVQRLYDDIKNFIPHVGMVTGSKKQPGPRITVYSADSMHKSPGDADIVLADEAHELVTTKYSKLFAETYHQARMFGFTATSQHRTDNAHFKLEYLFGPKIFEMSIAEATELGLVVPIEVRWINMNFQPNPCAEMTGVPRKRHGIWRNRQRNIRIAEALSMHGHDEQALVLVNTVDHMVHLAHELPGYTLMYGSGTSQADLNDYIKRGLIPETTELLTDTMRGNIQTAFRAGQIQKVIATDVWATGVDFPSLRVVCRADARQSDTIDVQGPGRANRLDEASGKTRGILYDCDDKFDDGFKRAALKRKRNYKKNGWVNVPFKLTEATQRGLFP